MADRTRRNKRVRRLAAGLTTGALALALSLPATAWADITITELDNENTVVVENFTTQNAANVGTQATNQTAANTNQSAQNGALTQSQTNALAGQLALPATNVATLLNLRSDARNDVRSGESFAA